ncbi:MAG: deoxyguanosinetriphosphate triphosphohydrolase [Desulfuromonas sp.]|nr:MAG: deoxyguanosinetriphosphate triphosphohydrolase [Desulfuromonas sp.]
MEIRQLLEERERKVLAGNAAFSSTSNGRIVAEEPCTMRTAFQVDRDRILHCKSFRRLKYKTQVFLSPEGDHYRTRLTHTLEVSQIARTIARALSLNEDLTEAIALGHDLGHTPFGHAGERVLNELTPGGFHHVRQSQRVVEYLENDGSGLNLSAEVLDGIRKHSKGRGALSDVDPDSLPSTLEGQIVRFADIIAYVHHDLDDALRAELIRESELPETVREVLGAANCDWLDTMIGDIIRLSMENGDAVIRFSPEIDNAVIVLRDWLFRHVYLVKTVNDGFEKASHILRELFRYFLKNEDALYRYGCRQRGDEKIEIVIADFIAGMTDRFALNLYSDIFLPRPWSVV